LTGVQESQNRSLTAVLEERLLMPSYSSRWAPASIAVHRGLAFPLQLAGEVRRRSLAVGSATVEMLEVGREKLINPIGTRLFGKLPPAYRESRCTVWSPGQLARAGTDLVIVEVHRWMAPRFRRAGWHLIPDAVRWQGDLTKVPPTEACNSLLDDLRKVRNHGYTIEHTTAPSDWHEFYTSMVRPQAQARHGDSAWLPSPALMRSFQRSGTLHLVSLHGQRVAGTCSVGHGDRLWLPLSGIRDGDRSLLRKGAGVAALALTFQWARSQAYRFVDLGRTTAFVNDGVNQFKRKWGLHPVADPLAHLAAVLVRSATVRERFVREPVLVEDGPGLGLYAGRDG
jgi:hypothetical protein